MIHPVLAVLLASACACSAGTEPRDAAVSDATTRDGGRMDGGARDGGSWDAGAPSDAGATTDANCGRGEAMSLATPGELDLFGTPSYFNDGMPLPAGRYRVRYVDGCMKYSASQGWTVNAYAMDSACWWVIGATTDVRYVVPPGTVGYVVGSGAYATFDECVAASSAVPPIVLDLLADGPVGVWLLDSPYSDNLAGEGGRNPRWALEVASEECPGPI